MRAPIEGLSLTAKERKPNSFAPENHREAVAESWDEEVSSEDETRIKKMPMPSPVKIPSAPPPTPISQDSPLIYKNVEGEMGAWPAGLYSDDAGRPARSSNLRPEKTDTVARRLIAGALGVRTPKKSDEQRAYENATKEKELKKKLREREAQEDEKREAERAKVAAWED